ncbi:MAG TPA: diaminopimelate decarboxylase, partial [Gammaproteobacteria bacterium]|nr:diaminopimelate decarboxylase [Gammaproteobacteria bacterium]
AIIDAGMNDLMRPSLYDAWHEIIPLTLLNEEKKYYDIVGPVCESADFFGKKRWLAIRPGDELAILDVGAYGFSMSSNYNSRPRPAEVMLDKDKIYVIRERESWKDLFRGEVCL